MKIVSKSKGLQPRRTARNSIYKGDFFKEEFIFHDTVELWGKFVTKKKCPTMKYLKNDNFPDYSSLEKTNGVKI